MSGILKRQILDDKWLKASVAGSLWATVEIIVGSFFHNLRVPMAGTFLAMISVVIMVAFHQQWKVRGLFWRAGLICALMKSISPSALLLGPMTGILAEALLLELFVRILGGNLFGYLVGGSMALASTIAHKIANLLIMYGFDFLKVLVNLYDFAVAQIGFPGLSPKLAVLFLFGIYAMLGMASATLGYILGKKSLLKKPAETPATKPINNGDTSDFFGLRPDQHFSVKLLFFHVFAIAVCLVIINNNSLWVGAIFIVAYVLFCVMQYKHSLKHLKRPVFWAQVLVLTFLATIFFNGFQKGNIFDTEGLLAGVQMNIRAVLILVGFSSISVELRNPVIKAVLMKRGFSQLYLSLSLAFSALPAIIGNFAKPRQFLRHPGQSVLGILQQADHLLFIFKTKTMKPRVIIITGEKHEGKTTFVTNLVKQLQKEGIRTGGFVAPGTMHKNRRTAFDIKDLKTGQQKALCSIFREEGDPIGPFRFDPDGQLFGNRILSPENLGDADIVVIDELGPLELKGKGWAPAIDVLMQHPEITQMWVVRKGIVDDVRKKWELLDVSIFDINNHSVEGLLHILFRKNR